MNAKHSLRFTALVIALFVATLALAQQPAPAPAPPSNSIPCIKTGQPLAPIPEITTDPNTHIMKGTLYTVSKQVNLPNNAGACYAQWVRAYQKTAPTSWNPPSSQIEDPLPGPTLRAHVGDLIELTFLNSIDRGKFPNADKGCDQTTVYPGTAPNHDVYPDCFAASVLTNVHYHGTHTNPNTTGDNVFVEVEPSPRLHDGTNTPVVLASTVAGAFNDFFGKCEAQLGPATGPKIWPLFWSDIPASLAGLEKELLINNGKSALWDANQKLIDQGKWPQYYLGNYPYCFKLPQYTQTTWPPTTQAAASTPHTAGMSMAEMPEYEDPQRPLLMGQSPGTHWYHAHKHGSTTINVMNGMTGVFIIEGPYDDDINAYYKSQNQKLTQQILVVNQLGSVPNLLFGQGGRKTALSVNGRIQPVVSMKGNEVQMWRIANTSSRSGLQFGPPPSGFTWRQLAQDGVQFNETNYQQSNNIQILTSAGNRADLLVRAPAYNSTGPKCANNPNANCYNVQVMQTVGFFPTFNAANAETLFTVQVTANGSTMNLLPHAPSFPPFLADITDSEIKGTKVLTFATTSNAGAPTSPSQHTIDGKKFDGEVGAVVGLNKAEEWKIVNQTYAYPQSGTVSHPFHIHINPFQVTEVFDPNATLANGQPMYITSGTPAAGQCLLNPKDPSTWHPCQPQPKTNLIWWDVFPIPSGLLVPDPTDSTKYLAQIPGYFKMRSRFVDYFGYYVMHCHILAHEDRGMMTVVEVAPLQTPYAHH